MRAFLPMLLVGCGLGPPDSAEPPLFAPPVQIEVGPAVPGQDVRVTLTGIPDGAQLAAAIAANANGGCAVSLVGSCSDLGQPSVRSTAVSAGGMGVIDIPLPAAVPVGATLYVQVAGRVGRTRAISPVLEATVEAGATCGEVQAVTNQSCVGCHGVAALGGLDLRDINDAVGRPSATAPLDLITAGDADASYLVHKLEGTHTDASVGGTGGVMPPTGPLDPSELALFRQWIDGGATCTDTSGPALFSCDPAAPGSPSTIRRLSDQQYQNALADAIDRLGGTALLGRLNYYVFTSRMNLIPNDNNEEDLSRQDDVVSFAHTEGWYHIAERIADEWSVRYMSCQDVSCVDSFIQTMGARLNRRPLTAEEQSFYRDEVYAGAPDHEAGMRDMVLVWLAGPNFTHHIEHGDPAIPTADPDTVALTAHELASRLSFHAWNRPPDDTLWALAQDGTLLDPVVYAQQVDRLFSAPESQEAREEFFSDWLHLEDVPELHWAIGGAGYDHFRGSITPTDDLDDRVTRDALDLLEWHIDNESPLDDVWTRPLNTVLDPEVAQLYETSVLWDGVSPPEDLTTGHGGLLTRPVFHVTGNTDTRPIHKGVLIRRRILCDELGNPPADLGDEPSIDPDSSQRERTAALTEIPGSQCEGCHTQINGLGYVTESIDSLGRIRTDETVYTWDGQVRIVVPVDDAAVAQVDLGDDAVLDGPDALAAALAASTKPDVCLSRWWFRHTWGRAEDDAVDGCLLQDVQQRLTNGDSLDSAMRSTALSDAFRLRRFDEGAQP